MCRTCTLGGQDFELSRVQVYTSHSGRRGWFRGMFESFLELVLLGFECLGVYFDGDGYFGFSGVFRVCGSVPSGRVLNVVE